MWKKKANSKKIGWAGSERNWEEAPQPWAADVHYADYQSKKIFWKDDLSMGFVLCQPCHAMGFFFLSIFPLYVVGKNGTSLHPHVGAYEDGSKVLAKQPPRGREKRQRKETC